MSNLSLLGFGLLILAASVITSVKLSEVLARQPAEVAQKGEVIRVRASVYFGNVDPNSDVNMRGINELAGPQLCGQDTFVASADVNVLGQLGGLGPNPARPAPGEQQGGAEFVMPVYLSKMVATGAKLGEFGPASTCNGMYVFSAKVLN